MVGDRTFFGRRTPPATQESFLCPPTSQPTTRSTGLGIILPLFNWAIVFLLTMESSTSGLDVFILSGQSNMAGRGGVYSVNGSRVWNEIVPLEADAPKGSILRLSAGLEWEEAKEPLHYDIDLAKVCGVGPGLVFAASIVRQSNANLRCPVIGLVPCAIGGTSISEWEKGGKLYNQMIERTKASLNYGGQLKCLLWYQGESDTTTRELADLYRTRLEQFFNDVRSDLEFRHLPIIQVLITGKTQLLPELEAVRDAQKAVQLSNVWSVDALGLPLESDEIHLTTEAQITLGKKMADVYVEQVLGKCPESLI